MLFTLSVIQRTDTWTFIVSLCRMMAAMFSKGSVRLLSLFVFSTVMLMRGGYFRLKNLTHTNSQTLAALVLLYWTFSLKINRHRLWR